MKNRQHRHHTHHRQSGYILPFVLVLLLMLMATSASFFSRAADSTKLSGSSRDYDQAVLLAESGINMIFGRLTSFSGAATPLTSADLAPTPCTPARLVGDLNCDGQKDLVVAQFVPQTTTPLLPMPLGYQFFLTAGANTISQTSPGILQKIADGEARNQTSSAPANQAIPVATQFLRPNDLFISNTIRPMLFSKGANGLIYSPNTWSGESSIEKVAVWVEVTLTPGTTGSYDFYLCSVAQIGDAKAFMLRYLSTANWTLGALLIAPISESSNHG